MNFNNEMDFISENTHIMNTFHDIDFPVYRSIAIEQNYPQEPPPAFFKSSPTFSSKQASQVVLSSASDDIDLNDFLNDTLGENKIAKVEDLGFSCLSQTTVYFDNENDSRKVIDNVNDFLKKNQIFHERKGSSKWVCESIHQLENIKFQIQIFSTSCGFAVEFLRLRGCGMTFSSVFRQFRSQEILPVVVSTHLDGVVSESPVASEKSINSLVSYMNENPLEAVKVLCSMLSIICQCTELLTQLCKFLIERKEVYSILTLASHLSSEISARGVSSSHDLLPLYDHFVPSLVKYSFDSTQSPFIRYQSSELMKSRMSMN